jgi:hypothetical protein
VIAAHLRRAAARCERLADHHAREACALAGHAVFLDREGETEKASALIERALHEERRETDLLELARAFRGRADALDLRRTRARGLIALVQTLPRPGARRTQPAGIESTDGRPAIADYRLDDMLTVAAGGGVPQTSGLARPLDADGREALCR